MIDHSRFSGLWFILALCSSAQAQPSYMVERYQVLDRATGILASSSTGEILGATAASVSVADGTFEWLWYTVDPAGTPQFFEPFNAQPGGIFDSNDGPYPPAAQGMNASGTIVGYWGEHPFLLDAVGFIRQSDGTVVDFVAPPAVGVTLLFDINDEGVIVGNYSDGLAAVAFKILPDGAFIDNFISNDFRAFLEPTAISNSGFVAGTLFQVDESPLPRVFRIDPDGAYIFHEIPEEAGSLPRVTDVNDQGTVVGFLNAADVGITGERVLQRPFVFDDDGFRIFDLGFDSEEDTMVRVWGIDTAGNLYGDLLSGFNFIVADAFVATIDPTSVPCSVADIETPYGTINSSDIQAFLGLLETGHPTADLDGNETQDFFDLVVLLGAAEQSCS